MEESENSKAIPAEQDCIVSAEEIAADWNRPEGPEARARTTDALSKSASDTWPGDETDAPDGKTGAGAAETRETDQSFTLKHLGEVRKVGREEVVTLAQKGLDYDRQRQKNEELLTRNRALSAEAERLRGPGPGQHTPAVNVITGEAAMARRRDAEIGEFMAEYKGMDPKSIPQEVWQAVTAGRPLLAAYQSWELKKLRAESAAAAKAAENRERSAGSRTSAGSERYTDAITADWYSS